MKKVLFLIIFATLIVSAVLYFSKQNTSNKSVNNTGEITPTTKQENGLKEVTIQEIGLSLKYPSNLAFRKEIADDAGKIRSLGFYVEDGPSDKPNYQLYGLYEFRSNATTKDLEKTKIGMDAKTIKEVTVGLYQGIEGLITGPKSHYVTNILKDGKLFSVSTWPPNPENKKLTDQILATFLFK